MTKRERIREDFVYIVFCVWYVTAIFSGANIEKIFSIDIGVITNIAKVFVFGGIVLQLFCFQSYTRKEIVTIIVLSILLIVVTHYSSYNYMASCWLFVFASKNMSFDRIVRDIYYLLLFTILIVVLLFFLGNIHETITYRYGVIRHSLGFSHPNYLGMQLFHLIACRYYMHYKTQKVSDFLFALIMAGVAYIYPNTYSAIIAISILSLSFLVYHLLEKSEKWLAAFSVLLVWLAVFFNVTSLIFSIIPLGNKEIIKTIDYYVSQRFSQSHRTYEYYGIPLFGQKIYSLIPKGSGRYLKFYLDNGYMAILLRYGIVMYIVFSVLFVLTMIYLIKHKRYCLVMILSCYSMYGLMENNLFSLAHNCFLLILGYYFFDKGEIIEKSERKKKIRILLT